MSRRIATDQGGRRGPQSSRQVGGHGGHGQHGGLGGRDDRHRDDDRRTDRNDRPTSNNTNGNGMLPAMPFPMNFGPNGMPMFPPGFQFPFGQQNQQE